MVDDAETLDENLDEALNETLDVTSILQILQEIQSDVKYLKEKIKSLEETKSLKEKKVESIKKGRGRPKKYFTEEERLEAKKAQTKIACRKFREKQKETK